VRRLIPPQWTVFLFLAAALAFIGFTFLPPGQAQGISDSISPTLDVSVSKPGVHLLAVVDGSQASGGALFLDLYADGDPEGFTWRVDSANAGDDLMTYSAYEDFSGHWTDQLEGRIAPPFTAVYSDLTTQAVTPNLQSALQSGDYKPTVQLAIHEAHYDYSLAGAYFQVKLPAVEFVGSNVPSVPWHPPSGEVAVLGPQEVQTYQTNVVSPAFATPGTWTDSSQLSAPYWSGVDPAVQDQENQYLFVAGLLFGVAGSALIGSFQDMTARYRSWREKKAAELVDQPAAVRAR
jgi:hypothetical protein